MYVHSVSQHIRTRTHTHVQVRNQCTLVSYRWSRKLKWFETLYEEESLAGTTEQVE